MWFAQELGKKSYVCNETELIKPNEKLTLCQLLMLSCFLRLFFIAAGFCDRSLTAQNQKSTGSRMKNSVMLSTKLLFENPWVQVQVPFLVSTVWLWTSVKRPVPPSKCISAWHYPLTAGRHLPLENGGYVLSSALTATMSV